MGQTLSIEELRIQYQNLKFIDLLHDKNYGIVQLYQTKTTPYQYIMDYRRTFVEQQSKAKSYQALINQVMKYQHKNIAKIQKCQIRQQIHLCVKEKAVHVFCNYYNFSLQDAINNKKKKNIHFLQSQLIYILSSLVSFAIHLKKIGLIYGLFRNDRIFLSPQGHIKLYLQDIQPQNKHISFFKAASDNSLIFKQILSPQQLRLIKTHDLGGNYNLQKSQIFSIAITIIELLSLDNFKYYFNHNKTQWDFQRIQFDLNSYKENYHFKFIDLLGKCLSQNEQRRPQFQQVHNFLVEFMKQLENNCHCIKLNSGVNWKRKEVRESKDSNRVSIMQSLDKLNVVKIETLKSSLSTKSTNQNWLNMKEKINN